MTQTTACQPSRTAIPQDPAPPPLSRDERARIVLETARGVVERGWLQHNWYRTGPRPLRERLFGPVPTPDRVDAACLVAAIAVAGHTGGVFTHVDRDSGPAIDRVWDALQESRGRQTGGEVVAPVVRRSRMRELVHWNDAPGRSREDVLGLFDRAISRTILDQMRTPATR